ncbi:hypothetical protein JHD46_08195 [Sulfurimonas sp. SAG-AH-194-C20]|nr:hypothetical protein [Sulfurimonas sp. SAG-AH-194-C20]
MIKKDFITAFKSSGGEIEKKAYENKDFTSTADRYNEKVAKLLEASTSQETSRIMTLIRREGITEEQVKEAVGIVGSQTDEGLALNSTLLNMVEAVDSGMQVSLYDGATDEMKIFDEESETIKKVASSIVGFAREAKTLGGDALKDVSLEDITADFMSNGPMSDYARKLDSKTKKELREKTDYLDDNTDYMWGGTSSNVLLGAIQTAEVSSSILKDKENDRLKGMASDIIEKTGVEGVGVDEVIKDIHRLSIGDEESKQETREELRKKYGINNIGEYMAKASSLNEANSSAEEKVGKIKSESGSKGLEAEALTEAVTTNELLSQMVSLMTE